MEAVPTKNNLATSRKRKSTATPSRELPSRDDSSEMAAGGIFTNAPKEAASNGPKIVQRSRGFQVYTAPILGESNRDTINSCATVPPRRGLRSRIVVNKARKTFPPVYQKSRVIAQAINNAILQKKGSECQVTPRDRVKRDSQGRKEDLLVLSTTGSYIGRRETVVRQKASKIPEVNTTITKLTNQQSTSRVQVPPASCEGNGHIVKRMPTLLPITKDMVFLPA